MARRDPQKVCRVLNVVDKHYNPEEMAVKIKEKLMESIWPAELKRAEITQLHMNPSIQSIEEDGPVSTSSSLTV